MPSPQANQFCKTAENFRSTAHNPEGRDTKILWLDLTYAEEFRKRAEDCRSKAQEVTDLDSKIFWLDLAKRWEQSAEKAEKLALSDCVST
jgi:hypothetical protein